MANSTVPSVAFLVSEEPNVLEALGYVFQELGCKVKCHNSMADCLAGLCSELLRPPNSGPASLSPKDVEQAAEKGCCGGPLLIMVVRGYRGMAKTVKSLKSNAPACEGDSLEEPTIPKGIKFALAKAEKDRQQLSQAETKVLRLILDGKSNKEIAYYVTPVDQDYGIASCQHYAEARSGQCGRPCEDVWLCVLPQKECRKVVSR